MKGYMAFLKKEFMEQVRTYRVLIMLSVFFLFGMTSPLLAKMTPEILSGMEVQGMTIIIPEATALDAYGQFFKNITQMGLIVILLVFGGAVSNELNRGTLINVLAKGLGRHTVILAKYTAALVLWTVSYLISCLVNQFYTEYLFDASSAQNLVFSLFCMWLYGAFILSLIFLSSTLTGGNFSGLVLTAVMLGVLMFINIVPGVEKWSPLSLSNRNLELITGSLHRSQIMTSVGITIVMIFGSIYLSLLLFRKKKL